MTTLKKLKQAIRARARKTGERYTAARRQILLSRQKRTSPSAKPVATATAVGVRDAARTKAGLVRGASSEAAVVKKTGHGLAHWFAVLDAFKSAKGHTDRAQHLYDKHGVPGWHAQGITVAYERARGLRMPNQSSAGDFQVSASKAIAASAAKIVAAFSHARRRAAWLSGADPELARALDAAFKGPKPRAFRVKDALNADLRYRWDGSAVQINVAGKRKGNTTVTAANTKLADAAQIEDRRSRWRPALAALKAYLEG